MTTRNEFSISADDVEQITEILEGSVFETLELTTSRFNLRVARANSERGWTQEWRHTNPLEETESFSQDSRSAKQTADMTEEHGLGSIRAPLPGTFYRAPKPGAEPFVDVGAEVDKETCVCIVETMKLMNSVHAGLSGEVIEIFVEDGEMVEKDAVLMRVRPEAVA